MAVKKRAAKRGTKKVAKRVAKKGTRMVAKRKAAKPVKKAKKVRCSAKTLAGKRCKRYSTGKSKFCAAHR